MNSLILMTLFQFVLIAVLVILLIFSSKKSVKQDNKIEEDLQEIKKQILD